MEWIDKELEAYKIMDDTAKIAFLKFETNKIINLKIDFTAPFEKKTDKFDELKAWIPVKVISKDNTFEEMTWTLNTANPFYRELLVHGKEKKEDFKIIKTGEGQNTRYTLVE